MIDPILATSEGVMPEYSVELPQDVATSFVIVVHQAIVDCETVDDTQTS